jgi:hypothetical protein
VIDEGSVPMGRLVGLAALAASAATMGCSYSDGADGTGPGGTQFGVSAPTAGAAAGTGVGGGGQVGAAGQAASPSPAGTGGMVTAGIGGTAGSGGNGNADGGNAGAAAGSAGNGTGGGGAGGSMPPDPAGPMDGDPNAPVFTTPEVACGGASGGGFGSSVNFMMDGRDVIVTYPCDKHAGAQMTFFLNLHGTTPVEQHFYQHRYFAIHQYTASHNIIVVTPSSVVQQWGNGDGGEDAPHLANLIEWVYATFHGEGKFDIRGMWVGGHSWGAMYSTTYVCESAIADKVKGTVLMSGIGRNPACADRLSVISTAAEDDIGPVVAQGSNPMSHGCDASMESMVGNNVETYWPNCDPGFEHANYFMLGKMHASSIDAVVVERIADLIVQARQ